ncbi:hypothetical protein LINPERHAP2_LOCUS4404 [Linum perenne]
MKPSWERWDGT